MTNIILDLEATCWENDKNKPMEIIEIGAIKIEENKIISEFQSFIKPKLNPILSDFCMTLTTITQLDVDSAESFPEINKKFKLWCGQRYRVITWGNYDRNQYQKDCVLHNLPFEWQYNHYNLKQKFAQIYNCKPCGLDNALKKRGLSLDGTHHRGIDDARNITKIYFHMNK